METSAVNCIVLNLEARIASYVRYRIANLPSLTGVKSKILRLLSSKIVRRAIQGKTRLEEGFNAGHEQVSLAEVNDVLQEIGSAILPLIPTEPRKSRETSFRKNAHRLLPLLHHISSTHHRVNNHRVSIRQEIEAATPGFKDMSRSSQRALLTPHYRQHQLFLPGKEFALLPDWQLRPVFVEYTTTELQTLYGEKMGSLTQFEEHVFNLSTVSHSKKADWHLMGFKTDGVQLQLRFGAVSSRHPPATNTPALSEAGYSGIVAPSKKINPTLKTRGVYRITEDRFDNKKLSDADASGVLAVLVDPGAAKPVEVREVVLSKAITAQSTEDHTLKTWSVTEDQWLQESRDGMLRKREKMRRKRGSLYSYVLGKLGETKKKTSDLPTYTSYARMFIEHIKVLKRELLNRSRKVTRWLNYKNIQKALDKLADRLMRNKDKKTSPDQRVLFFGDGSFKPTKGHVSVPRKKLVKHCGHRGQVFVLREWGTSKYCPHCGGTMVDVEGCHRVRRCSSDPNVANPCPLTTRHVDRDECATISLAMCAAWAVSRHRRPPQFCCQVD